MKRTIVKQPEGCAPPRGHYSHGVIVESPRTLYVAGQVPVDKDGNIVSPGDAGAQTRKVMENIKAVIEQAGGKMENVAKTTVYVTNFEDRGAIGEVRKEFFPGEPPANTFLVISSLAHPDFLVEIEAVVPLP